MPIPSKLHLDVAEKIAADVVVYEARWHDTPEGRVHGYLEGAVSKRIAQLLADSFPDPQPSDVDADLLAALRLSRGYVEARVDQLPKGSAAETDLALIDIAIAKATEEGK